MNYARFERAIEHAKARYNERVYDSRASVPFMGEAYVIAAMSCWPVDFVTDFFRKDARENSIKKSRTVHRIIQ